MLAWIAFLKALQERIYTVAREMSTYLKNYSGKISQKMRRYCQIIINLIDDFCLILMLNFELKLSPPEAAGTSKIQKIAISRSVFHPKRMRSRRVDREY